MCRPDKGHFVAHVSNVLTNLTSSAEAGRRRQLRDAELDTVAGISDTPPKVHSSDQSTSSAVLGQIRQGAPPALDASNLGPREKTDGQDPGQPLRSARPCLEGREVLMTEHMPQGRPPYLPY